MSARLFRPGAQAFARRLLVAGVCLASTWLAIAWLATPAQADTVTDWNEIMQATVGAAPTNANLQARGAAIVQLAVFEAVNSITGDYEPYVGTIDAPAHASPDAAVVGAAYHTLVNLRPASAGVLKGLRDASLAALAADGVDAEAIEAGYMVGIEAGNALLELRENDGWDVPVPYTPGSDPGDWQPLPGQTPFAPHWGYVTPFALFDGSQFRSPPPPSLGSARYAKDYNEVKELGRVDSPFRPQHRTDVANFYARTSPVAAWNPAARQVCIAQETSLSENARILALLAMAICDASIAAYDTKYHYSFWRPQQAIQSGGIDGNKHTVADPAWTPLIATPAFPSYASAHATLSGAARAVLTEAFGREGHAITLSNPALPGVVLEYSSWEEITDDIDDARIYGGIHFRFDQEAGARQGRRVGAFVVQHFLRPIEE